MAGALAARLWKGVIVVWLVATVTFALLQLAPGDPFLVMSDPRITEAMRQRLMHDFGLDRPWYVQYARYVWGLLHGDLGWSISLQRPVGAVLWSALGNTLVLMGSALGLAFVVGIALALVQVRHARGRLDRTLGTVSLMLYSAPEFWLAILLVLVLAYWIPVFPVSGMVTPVVHDYLGPAGRVLDYLHHLALPTLTIVLVSAGGIARYQRAELLEVLPSDFLRVARAKGVGEWRILAVHALRNALVPVVTMMGLSFSAMFGGATVVEQVFSWPGVGFLVTNAIGKRDYALVTSAVVVSATAVVVGNLLADLVLARLAPHTRSSLLA